MPYADRLHDCSIAGIPVVHKSTSIRTGRRFRSLVYPYRDRAAFDALGLEPDEFSEELEVIGPNFDVDVKNIMVKLDGNVAFEYVHPILGPKYVIATDRSTISWGGDGQNVASFRVTLTIAELSLKHVSPPTPAELQERIQIAQAAVDAEFDEAWKPGDLRFVDLIRDMAKRVTDAARQVAKINGYVSRQLAVTSDFTRALKELDREINTLIFTPERVRAALTAVLLAGRNLAGSAILAVSKGNPVRVTKETLSRLERTFEFGLIPSREIVAIVDSLKRSGDTEVDTSDIPTGEEATEQREIELAQAEALQRFVRASQVLQWSATVQVLPWQSFRDTLTMRNEIRAQFEELRLDEAISPATEAALFAAQQAITRYLEATAATLPRIQKYVVPRTRSLFLIAFDIFGDVDYFTVLYQWNHHLIRDPGAIPEGTELEYIRG